MTNHYSFFSFIAWCYAGLKRMQLKKLRFKTLNCNFQVALIKMSLKWVQLEKLRFKALNRNFFSCTHFKAAWHQTMSDCPRDCCVNWNLRSLWLGAQHSLWTFCWNIYEEHITTQCYCCLLTSLWIFSDCLCSVCSVYSKIRLRWSIGLTLSLVQCLVLETQVSRSDW